MVVVVGDLITRGSYFGPLTDRVDRIGLWGGYIPCLRILALRLVVSPDVWLVGVECIRGRYSLY